MYPNNLRSFFQQKKFLVTSSFFLLIGLTLVVLILQQSQENRQRASEIAPTTPLPPLACQAVATDTILVIDKSLSMNTANKITFARNAAKQYVDIVAQNSTGLANRIGVIAFAGKNLSTGIDTTTVTLKPLTDDFPSLKTAIDTIQTISGTGTCLDCAITKLTDELKVVTPGREHIKKVAIFLTDGNSYPADTPTTRAHIVELAKNAYDAYGISIYTIGLGTPPDINPQLLTDIATVTGGSYFQSPTGDSLSQIYTTLSEMIGKGSISGTFFGDANANGLKDPNDTVIPSGWDVNLTSGGLAVAAAKTVDANGNYTFSGLCNNITYTVTAIRPPGWAQTSPKKTDGTADQYQLTITNGSAVADKNFGFQPAASASTPTPTMQPTETPTPEPTATETPTPTNTIVPTDTLIPSPTTTPIPTETIMPSPTDLPASTKIAFTTFLHAIGNSGDNATTLNSLSNKTPVHPQRPVELSLYDENSQFVASSQGIMTYMYNPTTGEGGYFKGTVDFDPALKSGSYAVKIKSEQYLRATFLPLVIPIQAGTINTLVNPTSLITGDINNDNALNILDYNLLFGCYTSDSIPIPLNCLPTYSQLTDLNDDGQVNFYDLNLFIRELSVQKGQ